MNNVMKDLHLCFETLANPLRTAILNVLESEPMNVSQLTTKLGAERTRISHDLKILRNCNFVTVQKEGKQRIYSINGNSVLQNAAQGNQGIFSIIQEHKENNCATCHKVCEVQP
jgi:DNA-binding transcriptional ArsR family regulator